MHRCQLNIFQHLELFLLRVDIPRCLQFLLRSLWLAAWSRRPFWIIQRRRTHLLNWGKSEFPQVNIQSIYLSSPRIISRCFYHVYQRFRSAEEIFRQHTDHWRRWARASTVGRTFNKAKQNIWDFRVIRKGRKCNRFVCEGNRFESLKLAGRHCLAKARLPSRSLDLAMQVHGVHERWI